MTLTVKEALAILAEEILRNECGKSIRHWQELEALARREVQLEMTFSSATLPTPKG